MTLIAAFRCDEGVVICADTQETVGDVRVAVNKVIAEDAGAYSIAVAGTGNGDLIDGRSPDHQNGFLWTAYWRSGKYRQPNS